MKKIKSLLAGFAVAGLIASAAVTHRLSLFQESYFGDTALKAGEYRITVENGRAVISNGTRKVEAPVAVESTDSKFVSTSVRYQNGDGKYRVKEIRLGGTSTRLVFN